MQFFLAELLKILYFNNHSRLQLITFLCKYKFKNIYLPTILYYINNKNYSSVVIFKAPLSIQNKVIY